MSWTTPLTWVTGSVVTAAQLNAQIRDNMTFLFDPPAARIFGGSPSVANGTTPVGVGSMGTVVFDSTGGNMTITPNKITITLAGLYEATGGGFWTLNATGAVRRLGFLFTGGVEGTSLVQNSSAITVEQSCSDMAKLNANDTVQLAAAQNSGGALTLNNAILVVAWAGAG